MKDEISIADVDDDSINLIFDGKHSLYIKCYTGSSYGHVQLTDDNLELFLDFVREHYPQHEEAKRSTGEISIDTRKLPANITFNITTTGNVVVNNKGEV